jgi:hypothetical protein
MGSRLFAVRRPQGPGEVDRVARESVPRAHALTVIAQLLNQPFLLEQADAAREEVLREVAERSRRKETPLDEFTEAELRELAEELESAIAAEGIDTETGGRRGREGPSKHDLAFVPRDPILSMLQTAIYEYVEEWEPDAIERQELPDGRRRATTEPVATNVVLKAAPMVAAPGVRRNFEVRHPKIFSDPRYILSGLAMIRRAFRGPAKFNDSPGGPVPIANRARLVIVGDWGSGIQRALKVKKRMEKAVEDGKAERRQVHVIHLGDVYYSGWKSEYEKRFLEPWPVARGVKDVGSFTLNGNHDMYSGGHGYFGTCLADPRFARQGRSSFFALRNACWQFLALDTSYNDQALYGDQVNWTMRQLQENPHLKTVLLSHHQLFSAYERAAPGIAVQLKSVLKTGRIDGWFWGHEHRCLVYDAAEDVAFASCVGHGGIPEYLVADEGDRLPKPLVYDYRKVWGDGSEPWDMFGFVCVDLDDESCKLTYVDEDGNVHHRTSIPPGRS